MSPFGDANKPPPDANNTLPNEVSFGTTDTYTEYDASGIAVVDEYTYDRRDSAVRKTDSTISYTRSYFNKNLWPAQMPSLSLSCIIT